MSNSEQDSIIKRIVVGFLLFPASVKEPELRKWLLTGERPEKMEEKQYGKYAS